MGSNHSTVSDIITMMKMHDNVPYVKGDNDKYTPAIGNKMITDLQTSHASKSVLVHSIWCMMYLVKWSEVSTWEKHIVKGLKMKELLWAAFLHDIAKGTHCGLSCRHGACVTDAYSDMAYNGAGDHTHSLVGAMIVAGETCIFQRCPNHDFKKKFEAASDKRALYKSVYRNSKKITLAESFFSSHGLSQSRLATAVFMHWDLGTVHAGLEAKEEKVPRHMTPLGYLTKFVNACIRFGSEPKTSLLRLCLAVSFADNAGSDQPCDDLIICNDLCQKITAVDSSFRGLCGGSIRLLNYYRPPNFWKQRNWHTHGITTMRAILVSWKENRSSLLNHYVQFRKNDEQCFE